MTTSTGAFLKLEDLRRIAKETKRKWTHIIIHHSATPDRKFLSDFDAIKTFHMSYRYKGEIITKEKSKELTAKGERITAPWLDIGYHFLIEYFGGELWLRQGRSVESSGAHTVGMNGKAIGICLVGNYDITEPVEEQINLLADSCRILTEELEIPIQNIYPHHYYAAWKSCPGNKFNWTKLILRIQCKG